MADTRFILPGINLLAWSNDGTDAGLRTEPGYRIERDPKLTGLSESVYLSRVNYTVHMFAHRADSAAGIEFLEQRGTTVFPGWVVPDHQLRLKRLRGDDYATPSANKEFDKRILAPFIWWLNTDAEAERMLADAAMDRRHSVGLKATERAKELRAEAQRLDEIVLKIVQRQPITDDDESFALYGKKDR